MRKFPTGKWLDNRLEFTPAPCRPPFRAFAAMIFLWKGDCALLCNICDRGWTIPSGRVEGGEEGLEAALREAYEEAGATAKNIRYMGCYRLCDSKNTRWAEVYVGEVDELFPIPENSESEGRRLVSREELPSVYHDWSELFERMFEYSWEVLNR